MKIINKKTVYTFEIEELDRLILLGLISKLLNKEKIELDDEITEKFKKFADGLCVSGKSIELK